MSVKHRAFWSRVRDQAVSLGLSLVILGLLAVQLFDLAGIAREAYGRDGETVGALKLGSPGGIVAPVLEADLGAGTDPAAAPSGLRASIWLAPIASLRGGIDLGWFEGMSSDHGGWNSGLRLRLGGGLMSPLTPSMGVDLHAGA